MRAWSTASADSVTGKDIITAIIGEIGTAGGSAMCWNMPACDPRARWKAA